MIYDKKKKDMRNFAESDSLLFHTVMLKHVWDGVRIGRLK